MSGSKTKKPKGAAPIPPKGTPASSTEIQATFDNQAKWPSNGAEPRLFCRKIATKPELSDNDSPETISRTSLSEHQRNAYHS